MVLKSDKTSDQQLRPEAFVAFGHIVVHISIQDIPDE
jgi:hypothetical protein